MAITYKELAEIVGVSRGTIDRALHNRGRIDPELQRRILETAEKHGFTPSHIGRALALSKNPVKIGVIVHLSDIPFFRQVISGIEKAKSDIANLGGELIVLKQPTLSAKDQIQAVNSLMKLGIQGLAISPIEDEELRHRLNELHTKKKLPIVTFNSDIKNLNRLCFVGMNHEQGGRTAAGLMNILLGPSGGKVLILSGFITNLANSQRVDGFVREISSNFPDMEVPSIQFNMDDDDKAYQVTKAALAQFPDIKGIYMVSSGQAGACRALEETRNNGKIKLIVFDTVPDTVKYIKNGTIDFIIDQNAFLQGSEPPHILFRYLFDKKEVEKQLMYTDISIRTAYNVDGIELFNTN